MSTATETLASNILTHDAPVVPIQTRSERPTSFEPTDFPNPTGQEVNYKHSPVNRLQPLLNVDAVASDSVDYTITPETYIVPSVGLDAPVRGEFFRPEDRMAALAWQKSQDALHIRIPANEEVAEPITIAINGQSAEGTAFAHIVIEAMPNAHATVILDHKGAATYAQNVEIIARDGSDLRVITVQRWEEETVHAAAHQARVDKDAKLTHIVASLSGGVVRVNPSVELDGTGSEGKLLGISFADPGEHLESQVYMFHKGAHTTGDVLYKSALQGATARTVWIGDVLIGPDAVGTDSYEANRNLVLTTGARADSIPNLEIKTGDIQGAGHASATGRFDDEQLFYLQSRGISEDEARRLVVVGFLGEIVQKIGVPTLEEELFDVIQVELTDGLSA
ncbi:Fe-S cluster assembly protein SufD [Microbacterium sp. NC79]|uniref:Fe-S cluster assembly protein SufD n=1 Tax=Microbacterium sp. NC79 TaxID=2851009 RepID=UPI001C2B84A0|nr:Fe-S cluster assembly protein SufD [Microbacterium sp. NC79]MBV0894830.1 Fe-S cluster assembly protein SufD [Microbacterium sp. NC79]